MVSVLEKKSLEKLCGRLVSLDVGEANNVFK